MNKAPDFMLEDMKNLSPLTESLIRFSGMFNLSGHVDWCVFQNAVEEWVENYSRQDFLL